jgi:hypothetical protein
MFTRLSNFNYGNYRIANIQEDTLGNNTEFLIQIQKYENEALKMLLGVPTYEQFMSNLKLDNDGFWEVKEESDGKWKSLMNGDSFVDVDGENRTVYWSGLVKKVATIQDVDVFESMMASYIYFYWSLNNRTSNFGVGEGRSESKNAIPESTKNKRVDAWNEFVQWAYYGYSSTNVSLSKFLKNHVVEFPDANEICLQPITYYDI